MNALVIYDSLYGNTQKVAQVIAKSLNAQAVNVIDVKASDVRKSDVLVIGSPTHGGRATETIQKCINDISSCDLKNKKVAVFDTRFSENELNFALKVLVKTIGYAAPKIAKAVTSKGGELITAPVGFIVKGKDGPLRDGELKRAENWLRL